MSPLVLLIRLRREGLTLAEGSPGRLLISPRSKITGELRLLIRAHKLALLDLVRSTPAEAELALLAAVLESFAVDEIKVMPAGPRSIGSYARCPRHPQARNWTYIH